MIFAWIAVVVAIIAAIGITIWVSKEYDGAVKVGGIIVAWIVAVAIAAGSMFWLYGTETGKRAQKTFQSDVGGGLNRVVRIYDMNGGLIEQYEGRFDIDVNSARIIFDDENGKRHTIYYSTGTIIVDEV